MQMIVFLFFIEYILCFTWDKTNLWTNEKDITVQFLDNTLCGLREQAPFQNVLTYISSLTGLTFSFTSKNPLPDIRVMCGVASNQQNSTIGIKDLKPLSGGIYNFYINMGLLVNPSQEQPVVYFERIIAKTLLQFIGIQDDSNNIYIKESINPNLCSTPINSESFNNWDWVSNRYFTTQDELELKYIFSKNYKNETCQDTVTIIKREKERLEKIEKERLDKLEKERLEKMASMLSASMLQASKTTALSPPSKATQTSKEIQINPNWIFLFLFF